MTDLDRCRLYHAWACAMAGTKPQPRHARRWLARAAGVTPETSHRWGEDNWPLPARRVLDHMAELHPLRWPKAWRV